MVAYTRVSTGVQDAQLQWNAPLGAGLQERDVFAVVTSGAPAAISCPEMRRLLQQVAAGDTVVDTARNCGVRLGRPPLASDAIDEQAGDRSRRTRSR